MSTKRIVCGVTASTRAQQAALEAAMLARKKEAELVYVHVVDVAFLKSHMTDPLCSIFLEESLVRLGMQIVDHAAQIAKTEGVSADKYLVKGNARKALQKITRELGADLLVTGGRDGKTIFREVLKLTGVENPMPERECASEEEGCRHQAS
jgi:nucleotide-binding universal stress UspA family protein